MTLRQALRNIYAEIRAELDPRCTWASAALNTLADQQLADWHASGHAGAPPETQSWSDLNRAYWDTLRQVRAEYGYRDKTTRRAERPATVWVCVNCGQIWEPLHTCAHVPGDIIRTIGNLGEK